MVIFPLIFRCIELDSERPELMFLANCPYLQRVPRTTTTGLGDRTLAGEQGWVSGRLTVHT